MRRAVAKIALLSFLDCVKNDLHMVAYLLYFILSHPALLFLPMEGLEG